MGIDPLAIYHKNMHGMTPIHCACINNKVNMVEYMMQNSAISINIKAYAGYTPLHYACSIPGSSSGVAMIEMMLRYPGIDANARSICNETPLHMAVKMFPPIIYTIRKLLDHPCIIINQRNNDNQTPLDLIRLIVKGVEMVPIRERVQRYLEQYVDIENIFEEFQVKRRWNAYNYFLNSF